MSKSNSFETSIIRLIFLNEDISSVARGTVSAGSFWFSLHTSDPGEGGSQNTNEATYTGYERFEAVRDGTVFSVSGNTLSLVEDMVFTLATGGTETLTHFGIGLSETGPGTLLYSGTLTPDIDVVAGVYPKINAGAILTED